LTSSTKNFKKGQHKINPELEDAKEIHSRLETKFSTNCKTQKAKEMVSSLHDKKFYIQSLPSNIFL